MPGSLTETMPPEGAGVKVGAETGYGSSVQEDFSHLHLQLKRFPLLMKPHFVFS